MRVKATPARKAGDVHSLLQQEVAMGLFTFVLLAATVATVVALVLGISSMAKGGEVAHLDSEHWMMRRVGMQAIAVLALVAAWLLTP